MHVISAPGSRFPRARLQLTQKQRALLSGSSARAFPAGVDCLELQSPNVKAYPLAAEEMPFDSCGTSGVSETPQERSDEEAHKPPAESEVDFRSGASTVQVTTEFTSTMNSKIHNLYEMSHSF